MIITIEDEKIQRMVADELTKVSTKSMWGDSAFEKAVKAAVLDLVKDKVKELIKANPGQFDNLKKSLEENLSQQMADFGKRIANAICTCLEEGIAQEFKTYE